MKQKIFTKSTYRILALLLVATTVWSSSVVASYATPDSTAEQEIVCGFAAHTHTQESCYTATSTLTCTLVGDETHTHVGTCYEYADELVCTLAETEGHAHGDGCYIQTTTTALSCGKEETAGHTHGEGCYETVTTQVCGKEAHAHDASCQTEKKNLICTQTEAEAHTHGDGCYLVEETLTCTTAESDGHKHGETCYESALTCTNTEEGHVHDTACYTKTETLICAQTEHDAHKHGEGCYTKTITTTLNCGKEETAGHTHGDGCYETVTTQSCGKEAHEHDDSCQKAEETLICTQTEHEAHTHGEGCYTQTTTTTLSCETAESAGHTHGESCRELRETLICNIHVHTEDCYTAKTELTCTLPEHTHSEDCYDPCTCEPVDGVHQEGCALYVAVEKCEHCGVELTENTVHAKGCLTYCTCTPADGVHAENCMIHCTCEPENGVHGETCALYKETTIQSSVGVTVFGALPETAELAVEPLAEADLTDFTLEANEHIVFAYDISILVDGEEYQPTGEVTVTIDLPDGYRDLCDVTCASELIDVLTLYHLHSTRTESVDFYANDEADTLTFVVSGFSEFAAVVTESDPWGTVTIGTSVYTINSRVTLVDANLALLKNEAMGTHEDAVADAEISAVFGPNNEYTFSGFDEVYGAVYELLLANATKPLDDGSKLTPDYDVVGTEIWKISGTVSIARVQRISSGNRLIIVSDDPSACLVMASYMAGGEEQNNSLRVQGSTAVMSVQGKSEQSQIKVTGDNTVMDTFAFCIQSGSAYLTYLDITDFSTESNDTSAIIGLPSGFNETRYLYMTHSTMHDITGKSSPGIFCRAFSTSNNSENKKSQLWLYDNDFYNCVSTGSGSTKGGAVIRSYAADNCQLRAELCRFTNNQTKSKSEDASGGGAVYWKSAAGSAVFENCTFTNNTSNSVGGAIYNTGTMTINKCTFIGNYAKRGGGAIAVEPPRTNTHYSSIDTQNLSGSLTLDAETALRGNSTAAYGGGIYFYGVKGTNGTDTEKNAEDIMAYEMFLTIKGATITDNQAKNGGGVAMKLEHEEYPYETGIVIYSGSKITGNTATQDGGAIWMDAAAGCDITASDGVVMAGGEFSVNKAGQYGGAVYMSSATSTVGDMSFQMTGGTIQNCSAIDGGAVYMTAGEFYLSGDGKIWNCSADDDGGAVYLGGGTMVVSDGTIAGNTADYGGGAYLGGGDMIVSGGTITNNIADYGGGAYLGGGDMIVSGGSIKYNTAYEDGGGAYVSGGTLYIFDGSISNNTAANNGGGACVANGDIVMSGGAVDSNKALSGAGGGMYVSADGYDVSVTIYSGSVSNNSAGTKGGAVAVVGTEGGGETITVTLGVNKDHFDAGKPAHSGSTGTSCPVIENNAAEGSGGGVYITGGDETFLNIYCLDEEDNQAAGDDALSNFMMVNGGTVKISTSDNENTGNSHGNTVIRGSVYVRGGKVSIYGTTSNPRFDSGITVDIEDGGDSFDDYRDSDDYYKLRYFENFLAPGATEATGRYTAYQVKKTEVDRLKISGSIYHHVGYSILGWCTTPTIDQEGKWYNVGEQYPDDEAIEANGEKAFADLTLYAIWKMNGYTVQFHPNVPAGEAYTGTMDPQQFTYNVEATLNPNAFAYPGYIFTGWRGSNGKTYEDEAEIFNLTTKDGDIIHFYAQWVKCLHNGTQDLNVDGTPDTKLVYTADGNTLKRECTCGGQTLYATLTAEDATYDKNTHGAEVYFPEGATWPVTLSYTGETYAGVEYASTSAPDQAGEYVATLTATEDSATTKAAVTATFTIAKADQDPPNQKPSFTAESTESGGDTVTVLKIKAVPESSVETEAEYQLAFYNGDKWEFTGWTKADGINDDYACIIQLEFALVNYYVEARYAETANYNASPTIRGDQVFFYKGTVKIQVECDPGITAVLSSNTGDDGGITIAAAYDNTNYYLLTGDFQATATTYDVDLDGNKTLSEDQAELGGNEGVYLLSSIPDNCEILVKITGTKLKAQASSAVTENQVFGTVTGTDATISRDSAFTACYSVSNYDAEVYNGIQLKFTDGTTENNAKPLPTGTTIILLNKSDGSYWSYTVPTNGATSVALTDFTRMGSTETFSISGTNLSYQFIVDFSRVSGGCSGTSLDMTLTAGKKTTDSTAPDLTCTVSVALEDVSSFSMDVSTASNSLTKTITLGYTAFAGAASKWTNRNTAVVLTPPDNIPSDATLLVTLLSSGQKISWPRSGNGDYIIPLSAVGGESLTVELVSAMFPTTNTDTAYQFTAKWIVSNSAAARAPVNGSVVAAETTVTFAKAKETLPAMKVTGSTRLLAMNGSTPLTVTVTYTLPENAVGYTVTAELLRKGDNGEYISTAWKRTITSSDAVLEVSLAGLELPPGSFCVMVTMAADSGASTVLQVPYYFIAE